MGAGRNTIELQRIDKAPAAADHKNSAAAAVPQHPILRSSHKSVIPPVFDMQGAVALPRENQFALFGQWHNQKNGQRNGYLELRDSEAKAVVTSTTTRTSMLWHLSRLPPDAQNHTRLAVLENNGNDEAKNNENFVRARVIQVHPSSLCKTHPIPARAASQFSWLPQFVFQPPGVHIALPIANPGDIIAQHAWRINLGAHQLEVHPGRGKVNAVPMFTSSQYIAYSPSYEHAIFGDIAGRQAGLAVRTERDDGTFGYHRALFPPIPSCVFRGAAWFNNSWYVIFCNDGKLLFGNTNYPNVNVTVNFDRAIHALVTLPNEPVVVASQTDGSVSVYDASDALIELCYRGHAAHPPQTTLFSKSNTTHVTAAATAPMTAAAVAIAPAQEFMPELQMLTQLVPSQFGFWRTRRSDVLSDLAALHHDDHSTVLQHERGSQALSIFKLNHNHANGAAYRRLLESFISAPYEILRLVVGYYQFCFAADNAADTEATASTCSTSPEPAVARRHTF